MSQTILLIQHDPQDAKAVNHALAATWSSSSLQVEWVRRCSEGLERIAGDIARGRSSIVAILLDLYLPDSRGIETFDKIFRAAPHIPVLVLSASPDEASAKDAVRRGAQDYVLKAQLDGDLLSKAVANMIERTANAGALLEEKERAVVTLNSIGDAVMSTDAWGNVAYLNLVAERLTGWTREEASGHPVDDVLRLVDATSREPIANPMTRAARDDEAVRLTSSCVLIRRDGSEFAVQDSAAPIHDRAGAVSGAVMVFHDVSELRALSLRMSHLAQHDGLTDLPNRVLLGDRLEQAMGLAHRRGSKLAVLSLDLDRFKHVNDSLGHAVGDRLLRSVARRLLASVRNSDTVSRQGGDEFVILLPDLTHADQAAVAAEKLLASLRDVHRIQEHELHLTASIGVASFPEDGRSVVTLLRNAECAMHKAKDRGRDNYQFFMSEMNARASERQSIESSLRRALERSELVLHYQPKLNLHTGKVVGVEALVRWNHPVRGLMHPSQFISIAEECGLIVPIGRWVLSEACRQARYWIDSGLPPMRMAINISAVELRAKDFVRAVRDALNDTGLDPDCLELELTETFLMLDSRAPEAALRAIKALGVHLTLDDFGAGCSSLSYLKRYPIDTLKIDRSFVRDLATAADDGSIVRAVIGMGKSMNMQVVAEGVETPEQLAFLKQEVCPEAQGYFFSHPIDAGAFGALVEREVARDAARPS
jgi:diguanylate cyclase (GGDEF)-like protein/PAS domain S-box-containing protein